MYPDLYFSLNLRLVGSDWHSRAGLIRAGQETASIISPPFPIVTDALDYACRWIASHATTSATLTPPQP